MTPKEELTCKDKNCLSNHIVGSSNPIGNKLIKLNLGNADSLLVDLKDVWSESEPQTKKGNTYMYYRVHTRELTDVAYREKIENVRLFRNYDVALKYAKALRKQISDPDVEVRLFSRRSGQSISKYVIYRSDYEWGTPTITLLLDAENYAMIGGKFRYFRVTRGNKDVTPLWMEKPLIPFQQQAEELAKKQLQQYPNSKVTIWYHDNNSQLERFDIRVSTSDLDWTPMKILKVEDLVKDVGNVEVDTLLIEMNSLEIEIVNMQEKIQNTIYLTEAEKQQDVFLLSGLKERARRLGESIVDAGSWGSWARGVGSKVRESAGKAAKKIKEKTKRTRQTLGRGLKQLGARAKYGADYPQYVESQSLITNLQGPFTAIDGMYRQFRITWGKDRVMYSHNLAKAEAEADKLLSSNPGGKYTIWYYDSELHPHDRDFDISDSRFVWTPLKTISVEGVTKNNAYINLDEKNSLISDSYYGWDAPQETKGNSHFYYRVLLHFEPWEMRGRPVERHIKFFNNGKSAKKYADSLSGQHPDRTVDIQRKSFGQKQSKSVLQSPPRKDWGLFYDLPPLKSNAYLTKDSIVCNECGVDFPSNIDFCPSCLKMKDHTENYYIE